MTDNNKGGRSRRSTAPGKRAPGARGKNQGAADGPAGAPASGSGKGKGRSAARKAGRSGSAGKPAPWLPDPPPPPAAGRRDPSRAAAAPVGGHDGPAAAQAPAVADPYAERERRRYANPIPSREAIIAFLAGQGRLLKSDAIAEGLGLTTPDRFDALGKRLAAMLRDGQLHMNRRGGYGVADKLNLIAGSVLGKEDGFGFLRPDAGGDDIFLSPSQMRRVLHGDRVMVSVTGVDRRGRKEGIIVEILERRSNRVVGVYSERGGVGLVDPDDSRIHQDVVIPPDARGQARNGQLVVCEITEPPDAYQPPLGRVITVLGDRLTPSLVVETAIHSHGIPHEWPEPALAQARQVPQEVAEAETAGRVDLRSLPLVTIDGEDARDFDDAVYCETRGQGFRLIVAIADVSHYVRPGSALDEEARHRATSVYFPGYVVPMLPETLSNGICSLNPGVDRLCFACEMQVGADGEVTEATFYRAVMRSHARLTYTQVWSAVGERDAPAQASLGKLLTPVRRLFRLYRLFARRRAARGALDFDSNEVDFRLAPTGEVVSLGSRERNDAHRLIEECMIAANVQAALYLLRKKIPAPYRVHDRPPESKFEDLQEFLVEFGLRLPPYHEVTPLDYAALLKRVRKRPDANLLESVLLRSMSLAVYQPANIGHFGLSLDAYAHFTSPIRRYADLLVHRAIGHALAGGKASDYDYAAHDIAALATHCSENSRRAEEAERDVDERYKCAWMEQHVGSTFPGIISGVTSFGLFVELDESGVNGLVHVTQLPNDYYHFDPVRKLMTGERRRKQFRLGDRVHVLVLRASLEERKIDFRLVEDVGAPDAGGTGPAPATRKAAKKTARKAAKKATKKAAARKAERE